MFFFCCLLVIFIISVGWAGNTKSRQNSGLLAPGIWQKHLKGWRVTPEAAGPHSVARRQLKSSRELPRAKGWRSWVSKLRLQLGLLALRLRACLKPLSFESLAHEPLALGSSGLPTLRKLPLRICHFHLNRAKGLPLWRYQMVILGKTVSVFHFKKWN
jgi:hypothetical protein